MILCLFISPVLLERIFSNLRGGRKIKSKRGINLSMFHIHL
uniref:Uncharacterized protein n=1 Tax=Lepeophtheirus salmonis TaxID=72036 RepID=A0A0K2V9B0_LEPSM